MIIIKKEINVILSLIDELKDNSIWCGTFNLIWNDFKNDIVKQDIIFTPQLKIVENLNKNTFNINHLSENSYYKIYGKPSIELKNKIKEEIKNKFNETSDILDDFNYNENKYFLYVMLKKEFKFLNPFSKLNNAPFKNYSNIEYFGINKMTEDIVRSQVKVLYYNSTTNYAIKLITKTNDEVIISLGNTSNTFLNIYNEILEKTSEYRGNINLTDTDKVQIPCLNFKIKKEFIELENKPFLFKDKSEYTIDKALQTIQITLDETGGKIKSEAGMASKMMLSPILPRNFIFNNNFCLFLKEKDKELPYFAIKVTDIILFKDK